MVNFMIVAVVLGALTTFLTAITLISADNTTGVLKDLAWGQGYYHEGNYKSNIYVGVYEFGQYNSGTDDLSGTAKYSDSYCNVDFCKKCDTGMQAVLAFVVILFIASVPALVSDFLRYSNKANTSIMRWVGIIFNIICILAGAIGMITFAAGCFKSIQDEYNNSDIGWSYGPSFGMFATATVFKFVELIFCFISPPDTGAAAGNQM